MGDRRSWPVSLRGRLMVSYLGLLIMALATVVLLALGYLERTALEQRRETLRAHARVVAGVSGQYMLKGHDYLEYISRDYGQLVGARVLILDRGGRVLYDSFYETEMLGVDLSPRQEVTTALNGKEAARLTRLPGVGRTLYAAAPVVDRGRPVGAVLVVQVVESIWSELAAVRQVLLLVSAAGLALALAAGWLLAASLTRPVQVLHEGVRAVEEGDLSRRVEIPTRDELGQLAEAFNAMSARLERVEQSRRAFVANAAHELRTPLASLKALVEPLLSGAVTDPTEQAEFLRDIAKEVDRLTELAGDLLTLSELEAGRPAQTEPVDVSGLLEQVRDRLLPLARANGVEVRVAPSLPSLIRADGLKLERAIYNLVHNAITFSPPGEEVVLHAERTADGVRIVVQDRGPGIPQEDLPHIFERFYRSERSRSRTSGGAGLGLAIGREIVQGHGGKIWVETEAGEGTRFVVQIPIPA
jgi:two-component system, OmpR family, sensor kinase